MIAIECSVRFAAMNRNVVTGHRLLGEKTAQYTSEAFTRYCDELGVRQSMGRTGICWDNAQAESFFASLKVECVYRTALASREHARRIAGRWIETWYNQRRRHSAIDYQTPTERYWQLTNEAQAA